MLRARGRREGEEGKGKKGRGRREGEEIEEGKRISELGGNQNVLTGESGCYIRSNKNPAPRSGKAIRVHLLY